MSIFKCKMCGGSLEVEKGQTICECEYCGTKQTVSATDDEGTTNLYNRANNLRIKCEFDKAQEIYEKIVAKSPNHTKPYNLTIEISPRNRTPPSTASRQFYLGSNL